MVEARVWRTIEIRIGGRVVRGSWGHDGSMVQVRTPYGHKTTQIGGSPPITLARIMLRELAEEEKHKGRPGRHLLPSIIEGRDLARLINISEAELQQLGVRAQLPFISVPPWASGFGDTTAAMAAGGDAYLGR